MRQAISKTAWVGLWAVALLTTPASRVHASSLRSGATFLQLDPAARPAALAGAYTAVAGDVESLAYNPAGLAALDGKQAAFTHAEWLVDTRFDYLAYAQPTRWGSFGISAIRLGYGDLEGRDANRLPTGDFDASDSAYTIGYAHAIGENIGVGGAVKILQRKIASDSASSFALDFGAVGRLPGRPVWVGASVLNAGPDSRFLDQSDPLPLTLALGALYKPATDFKFSADLKHEPNDNVTTGLLGLEYSPIRILALRMGYRLPLSSVGKDAAFDIDNIRGGIGLQLSRVRFDYALAAFGELGITHRFTLSLRFNAPPDSNRNILSIENP